MRAEAQRTVKDFKNKKFKTSPELEPDPNYKPHFVNFPIEWKNIEVEFTSEQMLKIWDYRGTYGDTTKRSSAHYSSIGIWKTARSTACAGTTSVSRMREGAE